MSYVISTYTSAGVILSDPATQNPLTVTSSGTVTNSTSAGNGDAIYGGTTAAWTITNDGTVSGTAGSGIRLAAGGSVDNAAVTALIGGYDAGVVIAGTVGTVGNSGTIEGTGAAGYGVRLLAGGIIVNAAGALLFGAFQGVKLAGTSGSVDNHGTVEGSDAGIYLAAAAGVATVANYGTVEATGSNGNGIDLYAAGAGISNAAGALISGQGQGILIRSSGSVSNAGTIRSTGTTGAGIYLTPTAGATNVSNAAGGVIAGGYHAVSIYGIGTVTNLGTITSVAAIYMRGGTVLNQATSGTSGLVSGAENGVLMLGTSVGSVANYGTIAGTGTDSNGVYLAANGIVDNAQGGMISGLHTGIFMRGAGTVGNSGTIAGLGTSGYVDGVYMAAGTVVNGASNLTTPLISGFRYGVVMMGTAASTVANFGTIAGQGGGTLGTGTYTVGVLINGRGIVTNGATDDTSALISGGNYAIKMAGTTGGRVSNFGTILASASVNSTTHINPDGILMDGPGVVVNGATNATTALIAAAHSGIYIAATAASAVSNFGTIEGTGENGSGVYMIGAGTVSNMAGALIAGVVDGIVIAGTANASVSNFGTIAARGGTYAVGVYIKGLGIVTNLGTIIGDAGTSGIGVYVGALGQVVNGGSAATAALISGVREGVEINASGSVENYGTIAATATGGIGVNLSAGTVTNRGAIAAGTNGTGVYVYSGAVINAVGGTIVAPGALGRAVVVQYGTFFNYGAVEGSVYGIVMSVGTTSTSGGTVAVAGSVSGMTGIKVVADATVGQTLTVVGSVVGTSGTAVALGGGANRLILQPGAAFTGLVDGGGGASVLEIAPSGAVGAATALGGAAFGGATAGGAASVAYVALGSVSNFSALQVDPNAAVDPSGTVGFDTLVNQGQIDVAAGDAVAFGTVASAASTGVIALAAGGLVHFGAGTVGNQTLDFAPPGGVAAIDNPQGFGAMIAGFTSSDALDLATVAFDSAGQVGLAANNVLQVSEGGQSYDLQLDPAQSFAGEFFHLASDGASGTLVTEDATPCFCRGTRILTASGEVAVEDLAVGDLVVTMSGAARPIRWIGQRAYDPRFIAGNRAILPIRVAAGALAHGVPARDLWVSPEHALYLRDVLVPAGLLVNDATISQPERVDGPLEYFHLDLGSHDVVLAEAALAESYVDCDNRAMFHNGRDFAALYPDERPPRWDFCAPRLEEGSPELAEIRAGILARARLFGRFTADPDLHLVVDGVVVRPQLVANRRLYRFALKAGCRALAIASRSTVPANNDPASPDRRRLGVAVECILLRGAGLMIEIAPACAALAEGWHAAESGCRWTDGEGRLPQGLMAALVAALVGPLTIELHLAETNLSYGLAPSPTAIPPETARPRPLVAGAARVRSF